MKLSLRASLNRMVANSAVALAAAAVLGGLMGCAGEVRGEQVGTLELRDDAAVTRCGNFTGGAGAITLGCPHDLVGISCDYGGGRPMSWDGFDCTADIENMGLVTICVTGTCR